MATAPLKAKQPAKLYRELCKRNLSTFEIRNELDIPNAAGAIMLLRRAGYAITTHRFKEKNHNIARYVLNAGSEK